MELSTRKTPVDPLNRPAARAAFLASEPPDRVRHLWRYSDPAEFEPGEIPEAPLRVIGDPAHAAGRLGTLVPAAFGRYEALNLAAATELTVVRIGPGQFHKEWIDLRAELPADRPLVVRRTLLLLEAGAEATVLTGLFGGDAGQLVNEVVEVFAEAGARLRLATVLGAAPGVKTYLTQRTRAGRDANVVQMLASLGGAVTKVDTGTILAAPGAEAGLYGFALGTGRQHLDHHTIHAHHAPHTLSNLNFKVVLRDRARSAYTGNITIEKGAGGSEAYQENRNLLLSEGPRAESIPELEILTDDVRCSHGSTTGPIDEEQVFYLGARGLDRPEAERLIVAGFLAPTLSRLPESLADRLRADVEARLEER